MFISVVRNILHLLSQLKSLEMAGLLYLCASMKILITKEPNTNE